MTMNMTTADKAENRLWQSDYEVTADFVPFRHWYVRADGESWARVLVSRETGIPLKELTARLAGGAK